MTLIDLVNNAVVYIQNKRKQPSFRYGSIPETDDILLTMTRINAEQHKRFPFVYMNDDYIDTEIIENKQYETDLILWVVDKSNENYSPKERQEKEAPLMESMRTELKRAVQIKIGDFEALTTERKHFSKDEVKEFDNDVNIYKLTFTSLKYNLIEC